jgi:hypothetical protein
MKRISYLSLFIVAVTSVLTINSCKKEEPDTETQSAVDNNICETEFTKMMPRVNDFGINEQGVKSMRSTCPTVTPPDTVAVPGWPRTMIIDYGTTGCVDSIDGKIRKGQIICSFSNRWHIIGSYVKITLVNFSVNGLTYECDSVKITHSAATAFTTQVFKGKCVGNGWNLEWECDRTLTQTAGFGDFDPYNDVFSLTGSANGKNRNGKKYTVQVVTPVVKRSSCPWIESGKIDLTPEGLAKRTVDFGNGTCDKKATLTINGNTFSFDMN